jgi:HEPN domain-containing protein
MNGELDQGLVAAKEWMAYAREDLQAAQRVLTAPPLTTAAFFHAQQAAEKALKAYWTFLSEDRVPRTHDLLTLAESLAQRGATRPPQEDLALLAAYSVGIRYPEVTPPTEAEAQAALASAERLVSSITEAIGSCT